MKSEKTFSKEDLIRVSIIVTVLIIILGLLGVGIFLFLNIWEKDEIQTTPTLKLLTSHSNPQTGENWVVSFETIGAADLTITPTDLESIDDLDFVSLTCNGEERTPQIKIGTFLNFGTYAIIKLCREVNV